jgi:glycine cleavage system H protein
MLPVFILALVAFCLTTDAVVQHLALARATATEARRIGSPGWLRRALQVPEDVVLDASHVWLRAARRGLVRIGADGLAAALLGEPDRMILPAVNQPVARGQLLATLAREGRAIELRSPIDGVVARVHAKLVAHPERAASAPFGAGWLVDVRPAAPIAVAQGASWRAGAAAASWLRDELDHLRDIIVHLAQPAPADAVGATALDGGPPALPLSPALDDVAWAIARSHFFPADADVASRRS